MTTENHLRTYCVGRHLIEIPSDFEPALPIAASIRVKGRKRGDSIDILIRDLDFSPAKMQDIIKNREAEIEANAGKKTDILKAKFEKKPNETFFRVQSIDDAYKSELHLIRDQSYLTLSNRSYYGLFLDSEKDIDALSSEIASVKVGANQNPGFCVGPIALNGTYADEIVQVGFRSKIRPGVSISIEINTYSRDPSQSLLARVHGPESLLTIFGVGNKVLREGKRTVAGMAAQEWLSTAMLGEHREKKEVSFVLETNRPDPGPNRPHINVELEMTQDGVAQSDQQLIALWDTITSTIRLAGQPNH